METKLYNRWWWSFVNNNKEIYKKCLKLINVGKSGKWKNEHDIIGYNYAMPSLNASIEFLN